MKKVIRSSTILTVSLATLLASILQGRAFAETPLPEKVIPSGPIFLSAPTFGVSTELLDFPNVGKIDCAKIDSTLRSYSELTANLLSKHCGSAPDALCKGLVSQLNTIRYASALNP